MFERTRKLNATSRFICRDRVHSARIVMLFFKNSIEHAHVLSWDCQNQCVSSRILIVDLSWINAFLKRMLNLLLKHVELIHELQRDYFLEEPINSLIP